MRKRDMEAVPGGPNANLTGELEQWDSAVIEHAYYFTLVTMRGPARGERRVVGYRTLLEAINQAKDNPQALVYALTNVGRSCCIPRSRFDDALKMRLPTEMHYQSHIFEIPGVAGWFGWSVGRTTGPWPSQNMAEVVTRFIEQCELSWHELNEEECNKRRGLLIPQVNADLEKQGRRPLEVPYV